MSSSQMEEKATFRCASCRRRLKHLALQVKFQCYGALLSKCITFPPLQVFHTILYPRPSHLTDGRAACLAASILRSYGDGYMCDVVASTSLFNPFVTNAQRGTDFSVTRTSHPIFHMHGCLRCQHKHYLGSSCSGAYQTR